MPFDPASAQPETASSGFDPSSAQAEVSETTAQRKGYLKDPERDAQAYEEAKKIFEAMPRGHGEQTMERFKDAASLGLSRVAMGVYEAAVGAFKNRDLPKMDDFRYGKAIDRYLDDMTADETGVPGQVASVAGTLATPIVAAKPFVMATATKAAPAVLPSAAQVAKIGTPAIATHPAVKAAGGVAGDAMASALEQQNLATETDNPRNVLADLLIGGTGSAATRGAGKLVGGLTRVDSQGLVDNLAHGLSRTMTGPMGYTGFDPSAQPTAEELLRYQQQQLLQRGGM